LDEVRKSLNLSCITYPDYHDALFLDPDSGIDAVVVATPIPTHFQIVEDALKSGKHVLCEKPLCQSYEEACTLTYLAISKNLVLMVGNEFLFNPGLVKLKEVLQSGSIGELCFISSTRTSFGPIRTDAGVALDAAAHDVAIIKWLLNGANPYSVSATGMGYVQNEFDDVAFISMSYPDGVLANIRVSRLDPRKSCEMIVVGNKGALYWNDLDTRNPLALYPKGVQLERVEGGWGEFLRTSLWEGDVILPKVDPAEPLRLQDEHFIERIITGPPVISGPKFNRDVVMTLEAISNSIERKGEPIIL